MSVLKEKRFKDERCIAYGVIEKIKAASIVIESDDPSHKNGLKYKINKKRYNAIIETEFERRCARHMNRELIKEFINIKLKKL